MPPGSGSGASVFGLSIGHSLDNRFISWERGIIAELLNPCFPHIWDLYKAIRHGVVLLIRFYIKIRKINSFNLEACLLKFVFESEEQKNILRTPLHVVYVQKSSFAYEFLVILN